MGRHAAAVEAILTHLSWMDASVDLTSKSAYACVVSYAGRLLVRLKDLIDSSQDMGGRTTDDFLRSKADSYDNFANTALHHLRIHSLDADRTV